MKRWIPLCALVLLAGCGGGTTSTLTAAHLLSVPRSLSLEGKTLSGEAYVWRNLMPGVPSDPRGIITSIVIATSDKSAIPADLECQRVSVVNGSAVWTTTVIEPRHDASSFGAVVRNGPTWEVGAKVDVVAEFVDKAGNRFQLRAPQQTVAGVY